MKELLLFLTIFSIQIYRISEAIDRTVDYYECDSGAGRTNFSDKKPPSFLSQQSEHVSMNHETVIKEKGISD